MTGCRNPTRNLTIKIILRIGCCRWHRDGPRPNDDGVTTVYYLLSTGEPYHIQLMRSRLRRIALL